MISGNWILINSLNIRRKFWGRSLREYLSSYFAVLTDKAPRLLCIQPYMCTVYWLYSPIDFIWEDLLSNVMHQFVIWICRWWATMRHGHSLPIKRKINIAIREIRNFVFLEDKYVWQNVLHCSHEKLKSFEGFYYQG